MRFAGSATNAGEINNFGGLYRFDGGVTNESSGFVSGRGQFIADGGWTNNGVKATLTLCCWMDLALVRELSNS